MSSTQTDDRADVDRPVAGTHSSGRSKGPIIGVVVSVVVLVAMFGVGTKYVKPGSAAASAPGSFSAKEWAATNFPKVQAAIDKRAVDASTLADAVAKNATSAGTKYGVQGTTAPEVSIKFTGKVGKGTSGIFPVTVDGVSKKVLIRIQTGPAINGTDLRDAPGTIKFGDFTNQIDYQNAASALNAELKSKVLSKVDRANLTGKTVSVEGAFSLINPSAWLVTPSKLTVQ